MEARKNAGRLLVPKLIEALTQKIVFCRSFVDMLKAMNSSADPCADFYEYACGSWMKENFIPESKSSWSQFRVLYQRNEMVMKSLILDNPAARAMYKDVSAFLLVHSNGG